MWNSIRRDALFHVPAIIFEIQLGHHSSQSILLREACQLLGTVEDVNSKTNKTKFMIDFFSLIGRVYSDINEQRDAEYWDYENYTTFHWG